MTETNSYLPQYSFTENKGQLINTSNLPANEILYYSNMGDVSIYISKDKLYYVFYKSSNTEKTKEDINEMPIGSTNNETVRVELKILNANDNILASGEDQSNLTSNYFFPSCPKGITARNFNKINLENIYPGIDWVLYFKVESGHTVFKYDFEVKPGADPNLIKIQYDGAQKISKSLNGGIEIETILGNIHDAKPVSFIEKSKQSIKSSFKISNNQISFDLSDYNKNEKLVIDPTVLWSTYFGYSGDEHGRAITVGVDGFVYAAGFTNTVGFPVLNGYSTPQYTSGFHGWIMKLSPSLQPLWVTYYGGSAAEVCRTIDVDSAGNVFVGMETRSSDMPTFNAYQPIKGDTDDFFIMKLTPSGFPIWASYYGGNNLDGMRRIKLSHNGYFVASGYSMSTNFPMINPIQANNAGEADAIIMKVSMNTGFPIWSTYYGGSGYDEPVGITIDNNNNVFFVGSTKSPNFPVQNAYQSVLKGASDIFVVKLNSSNTVAWSTYIGSTSDDDGRGIAVDEAGNPFIMGTTTSGNYPHVNSWQPTIKLPSDAVITKFTSAGTLSWSTFAGGVGTEDGQAIAVDNLGNVIAVGYTLSSNYPLLNATQSVFGGNRDAFILRFTNNGKGQLSTYYGGSGTEQARSVAVDNRGNAYVIGTTGSANLPLQNPFQSTYGSLISGQGDCFMMKINYSNLPKPTITINGQNPKCNINDNILLISSNTGNNLWSNGSTTQSLSTSITGSYFVKAIDTTGVGVFSDTISISNNLITSVSTDSVALSNLCIGASISLSAQNLSGAIYSWNGPNGFFSALNNSVVSSLQLASLGIYSCTVTVGECSKIIKKINLVNFINQITPTNTSYTGAVCQGGQFSLQTDSIASVQYLWNGQNGFTANTRTVTVSNVLPQNAGSYIVKFIANGCESLPASITVVIYAQPSADAGQDLLACNGNNTIYLDGTNVTTGIGTWTCTTLPAAIIQLPNDAKSFVTNLKVGTNQFKWATTNGTCISVNDLVYVKYTTALNFGCIKPSNLAQIINGNSATLSWSSCTIADQFLIKYTYNNISHNILTTNYNTVLNNLIPGTYVWNVRPKCSGVWGTTSITKTFIIPVSPKNEEPIILSDNKLKLFPNPVNDKLAVSFEVKNSGIYKIEMFDLLRRVLITETNEYEEGFWSESFYTAGLSSGVFFIRLTSPDYSSQVVKFIKQ